jgi:hypothetical protein
MEKQLSTETRRHRVEKKEKRPVCILHLGGQTKLLDNPFFSLCLCASVVNELPFLVLALPFFGGISVMSLFNFFLLHYIIRLVADIRFLKRPEMGVYL